MDKRGIKYHKVSDKDIECHTLRGFEDSLSAIFRVQVLIWWRLIG